MDPPPRARCRRYVGVTVVLFHRNTIKALNWFGSVREKLDDPRFSLRRIKFMEFLIQLTNLINLNSNSYLDSRYSSWFIKFRGFNDTVYPGGLGKSVNRSFHVPACDWYNNGTQPRCKTLTFTP